MVVITMERAIVVAMDGDGGGYNYGGSRDTMVTVVMVVGKRRQPCTYVVLADYIALPCSQAYLSLCKTMRQTEKVLLLPVGRQRLRFREFVRQGFFVFCLKTAVFLISIK